MMKRFMWLTILSLLVHLTLFSSTGYAAAPIQVKELNFVFLHGAGGNSSALQMLSDAISDKLPAFIADYEKKNPGTRIRFDSLNRYYPNNVDIKTWADNIADSIKKHFRPKNLILIGHSMGGKAALYTVAHDIGELADKVAMVVTINSPIKNLNQYYFPGGADYWQAQWLIPQDRGVIGSIANYDSSEDGNWVGTNKRWLALVSAEASPLSKQFDVRGFDPLPRDMDDAIVPISAQYADGADVVYYGEHAHSDFSTLSALASYLAEHILRYIFGGTIEYSAFVEGGGFVHQAGWFPVSNRWDEVFVDVPIDNGSLVHKNESFTRWQEWHDIISVPFEGKRSRFYTQAYSLPFISGLLEARWLNSENLADNSLYLRLRAAPRTSVRIDWIIYGYQPRPGIRRDHYEIEIATGTPFTEIERVSWVTKEPDDFRLQVKSKAEGPLRWFQTRWRTYFKEFRPRKIIDEMPAAPENPGDSRLYYQPDMGQT